MPECCICGKEAEHLHHGLWWCENHHSYVKEKQKPTDKSYKKPNKKKRHSSGTLELEWV